jgi:hypothetical protein
MREITSYWFDVLREITVVIGITTFVVIGSTYKSAPISNSYFVLRADSLTII